MAVPLAETRDRPTREAQARAREREEAAAPARAELDVTVVVPVHSPLAEVRDVCRSASAGSASAWDAWCVLVFDGVRGKAWSEAAELVAQSGSANCARSRCSSPSATRSASRRASSRRAAA